MIGQAAQRNSPAGSLTVVSLVGPNRSREVGGSSGFPTATASSVLHLSVLSLPFIPSALAPLHLQRQTKSEALQLMPISDMAVNPDSRVNALDLRLSDKLSLNISHMTRERRSRDSVSAQPHAPLRSHNRRQHADIQKPRPRMRAGSKASGRVHTQIPSARAPQMGGPVRTPESAPKWTQDNPEISKPGQIDPV